MRVLGNAGSQDAQSAEGVSVSLPADDLVTLESIVRTQELHRRPARAPDYETENRALVALARALAESPRTILQTLADTILEVFKADSAGMSLLATDGKSFYWPAIAGGWKPHIGGGTPRDFGPCGDVLDCDAPILFTHWERRYPYLLAATPAAIEGLLVPFYVDGKAVGTIWAITHVTGREFDAEDLRQLESLGRFASAAYQAIASLNLVQQRAEAVRLMEDAIEARQGMEKLNLELRESEDRYRTQQERLSRTGKLAAAGQLAASIAHEINNPLSSVMNALYLIETHDKELDETVRHLVATASSELARVSRIVKQSLSYHRVGTIPKEFDLSSVVNESLQIFGVLLHEAGIELKTKIQKGRPLLGFPDELRQVIDNLLRNAIEAMPKGGCLHVSLHESVDWTLLHHPRKGTRLTIADSGCGIPREFRSRILDPFFTTKIEKGNGLGLWISQGIISKHEGALSLRSSNAEGKSGTTISLFLPSVSAAAGSKAVQQSLPSERLTRAVWVSGPLSASI